MELKHRGPDWSGIYQHGDCYLAHQRLAIIDPASGDQPLFNDAKSIVVTVNGEIYNHEDLRKSLPNHKFRTGSDCDVIAHLYEEHGEDFVDMLDGMFSFVLLDTRDNSFIVARDAIGITSLYIGWGQDGSIWISSEIKALNDDCEHFESFPPGHLYSSKNGGLRRWYNPPWFSEAVPSTPYDPLVLRRAFENAVIKRLMTDVPFGVLLSGGLDSSLVASITARHLAGTKAAKQWGAQLHSFCVGLEGSPDLKAAREVADYLGTVHHEFHFTVQDGIDAIEEVYHIETYDVTTIRATPMFLMARKIKSLGVKMVISGEGSDEIFGGYLYFHKAPPGNMPKGKWVSHVFNPFQIKRDEGRIEKWVLRKAFDDEEHPYLPKHILYRQKEQFSDGVGYSWIDGLKAHASQHVTDKMMLNAARIFPHNTPSTKEAYYYRTIFERFFPQNSARLSVPGGASVACSTATAVAWDASWSNNLDPSGRAALGVHLSAYEKQMPSATPGIAAGIIDNVPLKMEVSTPGVIIQS
ncbi:Asparagine synthetase [glutamine-hydrolyzing] [Morella rubra]|uniref:Asparagine synthetase [glutamine-hydrolyzing] n=1 Tax=Morella rubra TaxID=262757 RepID=A0A6A1WLZ8_9ROSI|nr:Asparagine synthetase [glutamine-hydrolyzing] [Morella rubra]